MPGITADEYVFYGICRICSVIIDFPFYFLYFQKKLGTQIQIEFCVFPHLSKDLINVLLK